MVSVKGDKGCGGFGVRALGGDGLIPESLTSPSYTCSVHVGRFNAQVSNLLIQRLGYSLLIHVRFLPRDALLSAVYAVVVCLSVCLSVCVCVCVCSSHSGIVSKRLNVGSRK